MGLEARTFFLLFFTLAIKADPALQFRRHFFLKHISTGKCLVGHRGSTFMDFCDLTDKMQEWVTLGPQWAGTIRPIMTPELCLASPPQGKGFYTHLQNCTVDCSYSLKWTVTLDPRPLPAPNLGKVIVWNNDLERCLQPSGGSGDKVKTGACPTHEGWIKVDKAFSDTFCWEMIIKKTL